MVTLFNQLGIPFSYNVLGGDRVVAAMVVMNGRERGCCARKACGEFP